MSFPSTSQSVSGRNFWPSHSDPEFSFPYPNLYPETRCTTVQHLLPEELPLHQRNLTARIPSMVQSRATSTHNVAANPHNLSSVFLSIGTLFASKPSIHNITIIKKSAIALYDAEVYCADCSNVSRRRVMLLDSFDLLEESAFVFTSRKSFQSSVYDVMSIDLWSPENSEQITEALHFAFSEIDTCLQELYQPRGFKRRLHALIHMGAFLEIIADVMISFRSEEAILRSLEKAKTLYEVLLQALPELPQRSQYSINMDRAVRYLTTSIHRIDAGRLRPYYRAKAEQAKKEKERAEYEEFMRWWNEVFFSCPELVQGYLGWIDEDPLFLEPIDAIFTSAPKK